MTSQCPTFGEFIHATIVLLSGRKITFCLSKCDDCKLSSRMKLLETLFELGAEGKESHSETMMPIAYFGKKIVVVTYAKPRGSEDTVTVLGLTGNGSHNIIKTDQVVRILREKRPDLFPMEKFPPQEAIIDDSVDIADFDECLS